jgi:hypothetical protein
LDKLDEEKNYKEFISVQKTQVVEGSTDYNKQFIISKAEKKETNC